MMNDMQKRQREVQKMFEEQIKARGITQDEYRTAFESVVTDFICETGSFKGTKEKCSSTTKLMMIADATMFVMEMEEKLFGKDK